MKIAQEPKNDKHTQKQPHTSFTVTEVISHCLQFKRISCSFPEWGIRQISVQPIIRWCSTSIWIKQSKLAKYQCLTRQVAWLHWLPSRFWISEIQNPYEMPFSVFDGEAFWIRASPRLNAFIEAKHNSSLFSKTNWLLDVS